MTTYAVHYTYGIDTQPKRTENIEEHAKFLIDLQEKDVLLLCGAYSDDQHPGALLIVSAESAEEAREIISQDPYNRLGFIDELVVREWVSRLGSRSASLQDAVAG